MPLTENECNGEEFTADAAEEKEPDIIDAVHLWMVQLEDADHVVGPGCDAADDDEADDSGDDAQSVENRRDAEYTEADLGFPELD